VCDEQRREAELIAQPDQFLEDLPRVTTSSAVVGSSMITTCGSRARAVAIMARCRMPPDSSCG
jgi:hypothetical protein